MQLDLVLYKCWSLLHTSYLTITSMSRHCRHYIKAGCPPWAGHEALMKAFVRLHHLARSMVGSSVPIALSRDMGQLYLAT